MDKRTKLVIKQILSCHKKETNHDTNDKNHETLKKIIYIFGIMTDRPNDHVNNTLDADHQYQKFQLSISNIR